MSMHSRDLPYLGKLLLRKVEERDIWYAISREQTTKRVCVNLKRDPEESSVLQNTPLFAITLYYFFINL